MLSGKKILIGITGSIAAYKAILLVRLLMKKGAEVRIVMTPAAASFVSPLTLSTLAKTEVLSELSDQQTWANHVMLGRWADVMVIAPLSCNTLAKMTHGQCDNLLLAVYLSATCPVAVAPAMDEDMWHHPATRNNLELLKSYGNYIIPVGNGELASGLFGDGRMAEPEEIVNYLAHHFFRTNEFAGKKVLITAGPTYEPLDPVRFIGNHSSGKMGFALANAFYERGAEVLMVAGPTDLQTHNADIQLIGVKTAQEMYEACMQHFAATDIAVLAAAVADYSPAEVAPQKIKKTEETFTLSLVKTKDILKSLGGVKKDHQLLVGFALETNDEEANAQKKLAAKNADLIVLNSLRNKNAGFGIDTNQVSIFDKSGVVYESEVKTKEDIARDIVNVISKRMV
ncbi:phosphopantothenoylcysteine decarboxylase / phosphopantothenate--cysteine ligase [Filimonas lacunae]|uniref:Coenzyme A biosynthesis bifunctional protein CoaBC n=1 Tax=Filimonas lacunae TaxID=477680 RepID=A0A173MLS7_9BACT|nr:bifunctional phosphopantothenoylcysteine decarboxylase/phosphopantothenate--cysteine ligase CoaBC [Filimonas lacunae]BAV08592.1 phosphopantothenoylcysteine decarboxylase [Filimonas lacunae]SIS57934.1 phosphopantothenoylcysteine decarboxylase / phosphopantothenate--cysteine ligase [Filimonas lacunae]